MKCLLTGNWISRPVSGDLLQWLSLHWSNHFKESPCSLVYYTSASQMPLCLQNTWGSCWSSVWFYRSGVSRRFCISSESPREAPIAGPQNTLGRGLEEGPGKLVAMDSYPGLSLRQNGLPFWVLVFLMCNMTRLKGTISSSTFQL